MFFFCEEVKDSVDLGRGVAAFDHAFKLIGHCKRHENFLVLGTRCEGNWNISGLYGVSQRVGTSIHRFKGRAASTLLVSPMVPL